MSPQYGELDPLAAEILSLVWGTPGNFNGFRVLAALLHGTLVVGVSETASLNRGRHLYLAGRHHVGHWPTFLVVICIAFILCMKIELLSSNEDIQSGWWCLARCSKNSILAVASWFSLSDRLLSLS